MAQSNPTAAVWDEARRALDGLPAGGLNIAHEAGDRHAAGAAGARTAVRHLAADGTVAELTYSELADAAARVAGVLTALELQPGERVVWLGGHRPELFATLLGCVRARCVFCPLFTAFGPEPLALRLALARPRVVVTTAALYGRRRAGLKPRAQRPWTLLVLDGEPPGDPDVLDFAAALDGATPAGAIPATAPDEAALLHFTSGTTGRPKGVVHVHEAVVAHHYTARVALDLQPGDRYWCTADPGWVTGISYGVIAPLAVGATVVVDGGAFDAHRWVDVLAGQRINVWYTSPTAIRMMRRTGPALPAGRDLSALRLAASVGEPLDAASVAWGESALGCPIRDTWWQTETGAIMIANTPATGILPGAMGKPLPGVEAAVVERGPETQAPVLVDEPDHAGELALRAGWPAMFRAYLDEPERYGESFRAGWYLTGDMVRRDRDGWLHFVGRRDDLIKSAGHLIGPVEVEVVLRSHPAVADVAVVGVPDAVSGECVHAHVVPAAGYAADADLEHALVAHARRRLGAALAPRAVTFRKALPYTRSGKIVRRLLRARAEDANAGDLSRMGNPDDAGMEGDP